MVTFGSDAGSINVSTERDAVVLTYRTSPSWSNEWKSINQRVPITWTDCHFGGRRPWFVCSVYSDAVGGGLRVYTAPRTTLPVGIATAQRMKPSNSQLVGAGLQKHGKFECVKRSTQNLLLSTTTPADYPI
jgi:hypothetical protein